MPFGQIVVGPPGCGKTTYCFGMSQFYQATERPVAIVNLDPANDGLPYTPDIDISELVTLDDAMQEYGLGPNGGLIYCIEYLEANMDWLMGRLAEHKDKYILFDCPGQVELFTHHNAIKSIIDRLAKEADYRLCAVHLVDAHYCVDPSKYVAMLLVSLKTMIQLELPHINVLSKVDLMESYGKLAFSLDYYTQVQDLAYLLERLNTDPFSKRYRRLNEALCELVEEYSLVGFATLCIEDKESVLHLARAVDKANGYIYGGLEKDNESIFMTAERWDGWDQYVREVGEKYLQRDSHMNAHGEFSDDEGDADQESLVRDIRELSVEDDE
ncbi:hypothetical protein BC831DRAFT_474809 [Entophlyctis helioformis]|nr:hypothetical protein BC831DRAFT_474809 [Entophlyctis helioformis]